MVYKKSPVLQPLTALPVASILLLWLECVLITLVCMDVNFKLTPKALPVDYMVFGSRIIVSIRCPFANTVDVLSLLGINSECTFSLAVSFCTLHRRNGLLCSPLRDLRQRSLLGSPLRSSLQSLIRHK